LRPGRIGKIPVPAPLSPRMSSSVLLRLGRCLFVVVSVLLAGAGARAQDDFGFSTALEGSGGGQADRSQAALLSEVSALAPGQPFTVALQLKHPPGWHSYYVNSANVEDGPSISWKLPEGFQAGPIQWPVPELITMF